MKPETITKLQEIATAHAASLIEDNITDAARLAVGRDAGATIKLTVKVTNPQGVWHIETAGAVSSTDKLKSEPLEAEFNPNQLELGMEGADK